MPELPEEPVNREPDIARLTSTFLTPTHDAYDRNHGLQPHLDAATHQVRVDGAVAHILNLSMANLANDFEHHEVVCALQCAGNRRHTMRTKLKEVQGIDWTDAAVMNCKWRGPRLSDVLERAGIILAEEEQETAHVAFACHATPCQEDTWYGASTPLARCLAPAADVILALHMNDEPLTVGHGFPVRVVTPGIAGARAVKWLDRITVQTRESDNFYMQHDYKVLPEDAVDAESAGKYWHTVPAVQEMPVNSTIVSPAEGATIERDAEGCVTVEGYALPSGDNGPVVQVEVSVDGGETWTNAELLRHDGEGKWSWMLWEAHLPIPGGGARCTIYSRATDRAGNTQPKQSQWNLRGVCYNGYGEAADVTIM
ncbi:hypothetical protein LTR36_004438 [Oleoguttula mirabilis]|uniref:Sulfite oxidase n=1 Tax=Oleoguttula mirabilis TaxID=1507867 RepID=A0AAV9JG41_9PEZI|nr:hypothetical protein LTR36_004438 [Oleoguttula mirabilis]